MQPFANHLTNTAPPIGTLAGCDANHSLAAAIDRAADAALFFGRSAQAERLAHLAAALREPAP